MFIHSYKLLCKLKTNCTTNRDFSKVSPKISVIQNTNPELETKLIILQNLKTLFKKLYFIYLSFLRMKEISISLGFLKSNI